MEEWKLIEDYPAYSVSNLGNIRRRGRNLKLTPNSNGYHSVALCMEGKSKCCAVARLVAKAFIPNPENKPTVDHINRVRTDNKVSNLRWATSCEQQLNRTCAYGKTGHRHITEQYGGYKFQLRRGGKIIMARWFRELKDALEERDFWLGVLEPIEIAEFDGDSFTSSSSYSGPQETLTDAAATLPSP